MIVRNMNDPEVLATTYVAHRGAVARMIMTSQLLKSMEFLAYAMLPAGNVIEEHIDDYEEIYFILNGNGVMKVGDEEKEVKDGDAIWLPADVPHRLENTGEGMMVILVVAAYPRV
jgi:mannose-6-phosphate isomerase-like protein (cupin superfamily)